MAHLRKISNQNKQVCDSFFLRYVYIQIIYIALQLVFAIDIIYHY